MSATATSSSGGADERTPLRLRLAYHGLDGITLLVLPALLCVILLFFYPFLYGLYLSVTPKTGGWLATY